MNVLELFAGAGGGILGSRLLGHQTVCAVELDPYCREILLRRQEEGHLEPFPIWDDVRTFDGRPWSRTVDIVAGGFPCQPWSVAGKQRGEADSRNLWPDTIRVIREVGPRFTFLENVPGLACKSYFWEQILPDLAEAGFNARWEIVSAAEVGAPHLRKRLWIIAYSHSESKHDVSLYAKMEGPSKPFSNSKRQNLWDKPRWSRGSIRKGAPKPINNGEVGVMANPESQGLEIAKSSSIAQGFARLAGEGWWQVEPGMGRVVDGLAHRMDRLRALGNGQVPAVVAEAWRRLTC